MDDKKYQKIIRLIIEYGKMPKGRYQKSALDDIKKELKEEVK